MAGTEADGWAEGRDGADPRFFERLVPKWWVWLVAAGFVGSVAVAYGAALGSTAALLTAGFGLVAVAAALWATSPVVRVDDRVLRAGRARLPLQYVGRVRALDQETSREASTVGGDPAAYLLLRMLAAPRTVIVEVTDPRDPHPYWLVSSGKADELAAVLRDAAGGDAADSAGNPGDPAAEQEH